MNIRCVCLFMLLLAGNGLANEELDAFFPRSELVIAASGNACYHFNVHVATNNEQWRRGLMHIRHMDRWHGMLFVYREDGTRSMWMKNTFIPLDMLFIRADGAIERVAKDTEPQSLASVSSGGSVRYVLELNAGVTERLGIRRGDRMLWSGELETP